VKQKVILKIKYVNKFKKSSYGFYMQRTSLIGFLFKGNSNSGLGFELTIWKKLWSSLSKVLALLACLTAFSALTFLVSFTLIECSV